MDNKPKTYFLGKHVPDYPFTRYDIKHDQKDYCANAKMFSYDGDKSSICTMKCIKCLFDKTNKKEFDIWIINQRLTS